VQLTRAFVKAWLASRTSVHPLGVLLHSQYNINE